MEKSVKGAEAFFTDDGFAVGCAYVLAILKQDRAFDSLHWWESAARFHRAELAACKAEAATLGKTKTDADRAEELDFKMRRVVAIQAEFDALFWSFSCSRLFFKRDDMGGEEEEITVSIDKMLA